MKDFKIEIKWAFAFALVTLIWMVLEKVTGLHGTHIDYHLYLTNLFALPAIYVYVLALKDKKNNFYNGRMTFFQGLISGTIITAIVVLLTPATQWIISYVITPDYFPNVIKRSVELGYYESEAMAQQYFNYKNYAVNGSVGALIMGILTTIIVMLFLRTKK